MFHNKKRATREAKGSKAEDVLDRVDASMAATAVQLTKDGVVVGGAMGEMGVEPAAELPGPFFETHEEHRAVALELIATNGHNRQHSAALVEQMAASLKAQGQLQNIGVVELRSVGLAGKYGDAMYLLVFGERRLLAARTLGWRTISAKVLKPVGDDDVERMRSVTVGTAVENLEHAPPDSIEEAQAVAALIQRYQASGQADAPKATALAAAAVGRSERWVRDRSWLAKLDPMGTAAELLRAGRLTIRGARMISTIADPRTQQDVAGQLARSWEDHSIPDYDVQSEVSMRLLSLKQVPWDKAAELPGTHAPACAACPKNSANDAKLFETMAGPARPDTCTDPACYGRKNQWAEKRLKKAADRVAAEIKKEVARSEGTVDMPQSAKEVAGLIAVTGVAGSAGIDQGALAESVSLKLATKAKGDAAAALQPGEPRKVDYSRFERVRKEVEKAQKAWEEAATLAINKACEGQPTRLLGLAVLLHSKAFSDTRAENEKHRMKPVSGTSARAIAACLGSAKKPPTPEQIAKFIEQDEANRSKWDRGLMTMLLHGRSHAAQAVVGDALGVRIDPMPTRKSLAAAAKADVSAHSLRAIPRERRRSRQEARA